MLSTNQLMILLTGLSMHENFNIKHESICNNICKKTVYQGVLVWISLQRKPVKSLFDVDLDAKVCNGMRFYFRHTLQSSSKLYSILAHAP